MVNLENLKTNIQSMSDEELNSLLGDVRRTRSTPRKKAKATKSKRAAKPFNMDSLKDLTAEQQQELIKTLTGGADASKA